MDVVTIEPFRAGGFRLVDVQDLPQRRANKVTVALSHGLNIFPLEFHCETRLRDPNGEFPIIRMGVFNDEDQTVGGVWLGCNILAPESTRRNVVIASTVPLIGPIPRHEAEFWNSRVLVAMVKHVLDNPLLTREGSTIQIAGFDLTTDTKADSIGLATINEEFDAGLANDPGIAREKVPTDDTGGFTIRITKAVDPRRP